MICILKNVLYLSVGRKLNFSFYYPLRSCRPTLFWVQYACEQRDRQFQQDNHWFCFAYDQEVNAASVHGFTTILVVIFWFTCVCHFPISLQNNLDLTLQCFSRAVFLHKQVQKERCFSNLRFNQVGKLLISRNKAMFLTDLSSVSNVHAYLLLLTRLSLYFMMNFKFFSVEIKVA